MKFSGQLRMQGFSLVEVMVASAVLAIILLVGVPSMLELNRDARMSAQADQILGLLGLARMEAIKERRDFRLCPATTPDTATACSASANDWSNGILVMDGTTVFRRLSIPAGITINSAVTEVRFTGTLGSSTAAVTMTICAQGRRQQQIGVALSGRVAKRVNASVTCT
ncbi:GspH/FimT family pseudopilin [uncultured Azonexus sp.]|uniref:GspH/FimT family pseudopilin n=1 Tax=uncultured Azonexus sp. TaxID=520307 RepID=UPI0026261109|nr:GspH/FimT family pseudopilin [uncultured Azonexus sp.]